MSHCHGDNCGTYHLCHNTERKDKAPGSTDLPNEKSIIRAVLVGNPNCGKTTLFNALTGMRRRTANYPGVTVDSHSAVSEHNGRSVLLTDLPGAYSIERCNAEETITRDVIMTADEGARPDVIISILDATALPRGFALARELRASGIPTVTALNMIDIAERDGAKLNIGKISKYLGSPVIAVCARSGRGLPELMDELINATGNTGKRNRPAVKRRHISVDDPPPEWFWEKRGSSASGDLTDAADRIVTGRAAPFLFAALMLICGFVIFSLGGAAAGLSGKLIESFSGMLCGWLGSLGLPLPFLSLIEDGIMPGILGVISFLPQIALLFLALGLFEDCGYMSRIAFITDGFFSRIGLSGRAAVPMLLGFGCTVPAVLSTRTIRSRSERLRVIAAIPFISCGARLPVYMLISSIFFPGITSAVILILYTVGICTTAIVSGIGFDRKDKGSALFIELPDYRIPHLKSVFLYAADKVREFLTRASTVILLSSVIMWFIANIGPHGYCDTLSENSFAVIIGHVLSPLLSPIGLGSSAIALALIYGLVSKESIVSSLYVLYGVSAPIELGAALAADGITPNSAAAFLVFVLLYTPCAAAFAAICREASPRFAAKTAIFQLLLAFGMSGVVYIAYPIVYNGICFFLSLL